MLSQALDDQLFRERHKDIWLLKHWSRRKRSIHHSPSLQWSCVWYGFASLGKDPPCPAFRYSWPVMIHVLPIHLCCDCQGQCLNPAHSSRLPAHQGGGAARSAGVKPWAGPEGRERRAGVGEEGVWVGKALAGVNSWALCEKIEVMSTDLK